MKLTAWTLILSAPSRVLFFIPAKHQALMSSDNYIECVLGIWESVWVGRSVATVKRLRLCHKRPRSRWPSFQHHPGLSVTFFVWMPIASYGAIRQKERWTLMVSYGAERVKIKKYKKTINFSMSPANSHGPPWGWKISLTPSPWKC